MDNNDKDDTFNASKAEVFEALGHPTRIRILQVLGQKGLGFSELKREVGIDSSGLLAFHLGKLTGLVKLNQKGLYALTDNGSEALRIVEASRQQERQPELSGRPSVRPPRPKAIIAGFLIVLVVLGAVAAYQQQQISELNASTSTSTLTSLKTIVSTTTYSTTSTTTSTILLGRQPIPATGVEVANVSVDGGQAIAVNPGAGWIYVLDTSYLTVINASSHTVAAKVELPTNNTGGVVHGGLAVDDATGMVYAALPGEVAVINGSTNTVVEAIPFNLDDLAIDSLTGTLWGTQAKGLVGVSMTTNSVVANVSLGFEPDNIALNSESNMVYATGCINSFVCGSEAALVNGTSGTLVNTVDLYSAYFTAMTVDPATDIVYVSGEAQLVALNGTNGNVIFKSNPQTCGPFIDMAVIPPRNQVLMVPQNYNYLLVYDGTKGTLVNMYSFPSQVDRVAYNLNTDEIYVLTSGSMIILRDYPIKGNVNSTVLGSDLNCLPP
ncbi:MAG: helix-turn-helix domain-containing protein [Nitrososphaerota archaeon]|jgi:DNA-binding transcriptional ArsR family regulator|nr:helix-turn-helix domain-containing protein [Nitrososphaerota archaeon]MDG6966112.1 helix-turn-helix domain-containing protein [Nitrososphaerota archaeon]MDG6977547.1 helix-turn-helix domain-containing protein [Nitrososphaerota archaeon]